MEQVVLVCGRWNFQRNRWIFIVDKAKGGIILEANSQTSYSDFVQMVYEDFGLDQRICEVKLSYKLSKKYSQNLPQDTPPVLVCSSRQLSRFLQQFQNETVRLCVEISKKGDQGSVDEDEVFEEDQGDEGVYDRCNSKRSRSTSDESDEVNDDENDEDLLFDVCDDQDGASSDDEDYQTSGRFSEEEENVRSAHRQKKGMSSVPEFVKLEMSSVDLAVGQHYDSKEDFSTSHHGLILIFSD